MGSPRRQVDLPAWAILVCCFSLFACPLLLTCAVVCGKGVPTSIFLGTILLCTLGLGWLLRVPDGVTEAILRIVERIAGK